MSNEAITTEDFFDSFEGTGNQTGADEVLEESDIGPADTEHTGEEVAHEGESVPEGVESSDGEESHTGEEKGAESPVGGETFVLKWNKAEHTKSRDEVIALAQKGMDYDRIRDAADKAKSDNKALSEQVERMKGVYDLIESIATESKTSIPDLMKAFRLNRLKGQGLSDEAAAERMAREDAERELQALKAQTKPAEESPEDRSKREVAEFRREYPDVEMSEELVQKLMADVQSGMSLTQAYRKYEAAQKDAEIARLQAELEAEKKNRSNRASSPGSQNDSGARRVKSQTDAFFEAFS